ncbi:EAL domain-containing protein [Nocardioides mangrovicus]|uniref:EAL domain-containing protein n=1 Tax=Nocardioides mangrovicus TaxID=2478913 RepID=A0A3L8P6F6_9ACTN|nr:EAL domain-containing protein [Nocardioides mangrovicus]RLV50811.1 EAL domain-containing protein [Nocardioides mangrovicus]
MTASSSTPTASAPFGVSESTASRLVTGQLSALIEMSDDFVAVSNLDDSLSYLNAAGRRLLGIAADADLRGVSVLGLFSAAARARAAEFDAELAQQGSWRGTTALRHQHTAEDIPVAGGCYLVRHPTTGTVSGIATVFRDLRPARDANRVLRSQVAASHAVARFNQLALTCGVAELSTEAVRMIDALYPSLMNGILQLDPTGTTLVMTACTEPAFVGETAPIDKTSVTGRAVVLNRIVASHDIANDPDFADLTVAESYGRQSMLCCPITGPDGVWGVFGFSSSQPRVWTDDDQTFVSAIASTLGAVIRREALQLQLEHQALHDPLTSLPNRALLGATLDRALVAAAGRETAVAALLLDLDDFKLINDTLGHDVGDQLLQNVALRLRETAPAGATVARLGGDEFVVVCEAMAEPQAEALAERLQASLRREMELAGRRLVVRTSIGVAVAHGRALPEDPLLGRADIAMYAAKRERRSGYRLFDVSMLEETRHQLGLAQRLRTALRKGHIEAHYQPIVDVATGRVCALEALARWTDEGRAVAPDEFIAVAEQTGMIHDLGEVVLRRVVQDVQTWGDVEELRVTVNASAAELCREGFAERTVAIIGEGRHRLDRFGIEITESMLLGDDPVTLGNLRALREAGISLLIDDFGTGYSSLGYLSRFPVADVLKIDRSLLDCDERNGRVVAAVVGVGHAFDLRVCAEGVETAEQLRMLEELGCDAAQGWHLGRPVPSAQVPSVLGR